MRGDLLEGYFALLDANFLSSWCQFPFSRAQNRGFCAFLAFGTPVFGHSEHKIGVFVLFLPSGPPFSGISSTKSGFLCAFSLRDPRFQAFQAQNRHFCARGSLFRGGARGVLLWDSGRECWTERIDRGASPGSPDAVSTRVVLPGSCCSGCGSVYLFAPMSAKSSFLKVAASLKSSACIPAAMAPSTLAGLSSVKRHSEALSPNFWQSRS